MTLIDRIAAAILAANAGTPRSPAALHLASAVAAVTEQTETRPAAKHGWYALPGGRLELGQTGFVIELRTDRSVLHAFLLIDPDGRPLSSANVLQPLKTFAEECARDREEFRP